MATRNRAKVVIDRLADAKKRQRANGVMLSRHYMMCARCSHAKDNYREYCDTGWRLAKRMSRLNYLVFTLAEEIANRPVQGTLF